MSSINLDTDFYETEDPIWNPALLTIPVPGIRRMVNLASTMEDVIHLSIGQPDLKPPEHVVEAAVNALHAGQTGYTMDAGLPELLEALAEYYGERYNRTLVPENIMITTGATAAPLSPSQRIARIAATVAAKLLTKLLPIRITDSRRSVRRSRLSTRTAARCPWRARCRRR